MQRRKREGRAKWKWEKTTHLEVERQKPLNEKISLIGYFGEFDSINLNSG